MKNSDKDKIRSLLSFGSDIAGAVSAGAIAFITGNFQGAILGGAYGVILTKSMTEVVDRVLSFREKTRIGATAAFALMKIKSHLDFGDALRDDGFFKQKEQKRADAEEIFEGVLLKAKNEHEEKKTKILGNILANVAFSPGFSIGEANYLLSVAEKLTYRGMCILSLVHRKENIDGIRLRKHNYVEDSRDEKKIYKISPQESVSGETMSILQETYEIYHLGLLVCRDKNDIIGDAYWALLDWADVVPDDLELTDMGIRYYKMMDLDDIPIEDIRKLSDYLS